MSGITAVFSKNSGKYLKPMQKMLKTIKYRGPEKQQIVSLKKAIIGKSKEEKESELNYQFDDFIVAVDADESIANCNYLPEEIIIKSYLEKGDNFVENLKGAFAFIISDGENIFAARDPLGIKPLYYIKTKDAIIFASEIKALIHYKEKINTFPPGYYYSSKKGFVKYYSPKIQQIEEISPTKAATEVRKRVVGVIEKICKANEDIGVFLSGGLDSSIIAAACASVCSKLDTFSVGAKGSEDLSKAKKVANYLGSNHNEYVYSLDEMLEVLPEAIYHLESFDMYLVRSAVINYLLARSAKASGKELVLCGEGADEIFAGYQYLKKLDINNINSELKKLLFSGHANGFQRVDRMSAAFSIQPFLPFANLNVAEYALRLPPEIKLHDDGQGKKIEKWILRKAFENDLPKDIIWRKKQKFFDGAGSGNLLERYAEEVISDEEFNNEKKINDGLILRSKEELFYYKIFKRFFPESYVLETVGFTKTA